MAASKRKRNIFLVLAVVFALLAALLIYYLYYCDQAANPSPSPVSSETVVDEDGFPEVDWDYWQNVNEDVIGWITIPGTNVNHPILQAHPSDPDYYLSHDVYGNYNVYGAIYLDAECEEHGLSSRNAVILGHHFRGNPSGAPFGVISEYVDAAFAEEHVTVLVQTPDSKMTYEVRFAQIVNGSEATKRTSFESYGDYRMWYSEALDSAAMVLDAETEPEQTISLVTCSYYIWSANERTVVVTSQAAPVLTEKQDATDVALFEAISEGGTG